MRDQRAEALARILVQYSAAVKEGDVCVIQGGTMAEPLIQAVYEEILRAGGLPIMTDDKVHIGGIGVSGGTADQDETCAQAGIDAVKDALK